MGRSADEVIAAIDSFEPAGGDWRGLDELVAELLASDGAVDRAGAMLRVFERFPDDDGGGVFWSIVHGLETLPGYESRLVESVRRAATDFGLVMVNRLVNSGVGSVDGVPLLGILRQVASDTAARPTARSRAEKLVRYHQEKEQNGA